MSPVQGIARLGAAAQDAVQPIALRACGNASGDRPPAAMIPLHSLVEWISPRAFVAGLRFPSVNAVLAP